MRSKIFLAVLLLTPLLVLMISTLSFQTGYSPKYTKNNGIFFAEYFDVTNLNLMDDEENLKTGRQNIDAYHLQTACKAIGV